MPGVSYGDKRKTSPRWAQDQLDRHSLIQGGGFLERTEFTLPNADGFNIVYSGTLVGRTYAEKEAGTGFGVADIDNDEQFFLLVHDVNFDDQVFGADGQATLYRNGSQVREDMLPEYLATPSNGYKEKIRELYTVV